MFLKVTILCKICELIPNVLENLEQYMVQNNHWVKYNYARRCYEVAFLYICSQASDGCANECKHSRRKVNIRQRLPWIEQSTQFPEENKFRFASGHPSRALTTIFSMELEAIVEIRPSSVQVTYETVNKGFLKVLDNWHLIQNHYGYGITLDLIKELSPVWIIIMGNMMNIIK